MRFILEMLATSTPIECESNCAMKIVVLYVFQQTYVVFSCGRYGPMTLTSFLCIYMVYNKNWSLNGIAWILPFKFYGLQSRYKRLLLICFRKSHPRELYDQVTGKLACSSSNNFTTSSVSVCNHIYTVIEVLVLIDFLESVTLLL